MSHFFKKPTLVSPVPPGGGHLALLPLDASPARRGRLPQRCAARQSAARRGLDRRMRMGDADVSGVSWRQGLGTVRWEKLGGKVFVG
jgi:hypothetical protein